MLRSEHDNWLSWVKTRQMLGLFSRFLTETLIKDSIFLFQFIHATMYRFIHPVRGKITCQRMYTLFVWWVLTPFSWGHEITPGFGGTTPVCTLPAGRSAVCLLFLMEPFSLYSRCLSTRVLFLFIGTHTWESVSHNLGHPLRIYVKTISCISSSLFFSVSQFSRQNFLWVYCIFYTASGLS